MADPLSLPPADRIAPHEEKEHGMITADDLDNLRHMLGVEKRTPRGYRNYFVAGGKDVWGSAWSSSIHAHKWAYTQQ